MARPIARTGLGCLGPDTGPIPSRPAARTYSTGSHRQETYVPRRLLLAATGAIALVAAGLGSVTAQAAVPAAAGSAITTRASCGSSPAKGQVRCFALQRTDAAAKSSAQRMNSALSAARAAGRAAAASTPSGLGPAQIQSAYTLRGLKSGGRTVAIVDAYHDPTAASDLATYRLQYGLPACGSGCFSQVNQSGVASSYPTVDAGWAEEISLDLDMVSATCPDCKILLVEANSSSIANLGAAVNTAARLGATAISNSYGGSDLPDSSYGAPYNHPGIAVTASSGDSGYGAQFPADSRYVTAVGGTSLRSTTANARGWTETVWSGAGSGCSRYNSALAAAASFNTGCSLRAEADVSAVADPATGVAVYDTTVPSGDTPGWLVFGGTSASSPIIASVYALSGRTGSSSQLANAIPYANPGQLFDVTSGSNGHCRVKQLCTARTGWDGPTGLGTPNGTGAF
jgi:subtilase family serine protease